MKASDAYPITYGILGLLVKWGPLSGYDIKRLFDYTLAPMWGAAHSQIYKELRRMEALDWVEMEREEQESRPDRKVYCATEQGQAALRAWLSRSPGVFQLRDELLLKVLFGSIASLDNLAHNLRASIGMHEMRLLAYRQNALLLPLQASFPHGNKRPNPYEAGSREDPYLNLIADFAITFEKMYLQWLYEALKMVEQSQEQPIENKSEASES